MVRKLWLLERIDGDVKLKNQWKATDVNKILITIVNFVPDGFASGDIVFAKPLASLTPSMQPHIYDFVSKDKGVNNG